MFHEWARHLRDVKRSIYVYVKRDVCILEKRRVDSIYEWAMSHARARYLRVMSHVRTRVLRDVKRDICIYVSKEMYIHVKRDSHVTRTDEGLERCQKRHMYI